MSEEVEKELKKIPGLSWLIKQAKKIILPGLEGLSLYDLWEIYSVGIIKGIFLQEQDRSLLAFLWPSFFVVYSEFNSVRVVYRRFSVRSISLYGYAYHHKLQNFLMRFLPILSITQEVVYFP